MLLVSSITGSACGTQITKLLFSFSRRTKVRIEQMGLSLCFPHLAPFYLFMVGQRNPENFLPYIGVSYRLLCWVLLASIK